MLLFNIFQLFSIHTNSKCLNPLEYFPVSDRHRKVLKRRHTFIAINRLQLYFFLNSISVISGWWEGDNVCNGPLLRTERISSISFHPGSDQFHIVSISFSSIYANIPYFLVIKWSFFSLPKQSQKSRSIL